VEWAKSRRLDASICNKFIEHEITGHVLLDLDVNNLKSELKITAFGNRVRIANAIQTHPPHPFLRPGSTRRA